MSSSMRNAIQRRSHRERAQPLERKRLGLLEKHKDYSLRAKDWNKKKATLKSLREKAAERNEDEFSYKMLSRKGTSSSLMTGSDEKRNRTWNGTVNGDRGFKAMSVETVRLLKTQDIGYLRTVRNVALKEVAKLEERAAVAKSFATGAVEEEDDEDSEDDDFSDFDSAPKPKNNKQKALPPVKPTRIVFADNADDRDDAAIAKMEEIEAQADAEEAMDASSRKKASFKAENAARLQRRLAKARLRVQALTEAEHQLDLQRARMAKTKTVATVSNTGRKSKARARKR
ncbi:u3 snornp-associated protein utp11 [Ophiostoma piceae UAMH 11346]|uniref:U3 snornp-associated protein utp11 n=1 Tax=Ophiostoma piceae (strain UAMH 11346) TaxID=1262450 RepID=S3CPZ2_OPHP1|nr:u3 snornp-associated protein utp11 [Ophiostoma piceae UAMH 11346]